MLIGIASTALATKIPIYASCKDYAFEFGNQYGCSLYNVNITDADQRAVVSFAKHQSGKDRSHVTAFVATQQNIQFLPDGIYDIYSNLDSFYVTKSGLQSIEGFKFSPKMTKAIFDYNAIKSIRSDTFSTTPNMERISFRGNQIRTLQPGTFNGMPNLRFVRFSGNNIQKLAGNTFASNRNLEYISFHGNNMANIGADLVKQMTKLKEVNFDNNICINDAFFEDPNMVPSLTQHFMDFCSGKCDGLVAVQKEISRLEEAALPVNERTKVYMKEKAAYCKTH